MLAATREEIEQRVSFRACSRTRAIRLSANDRSASLRLRNTARHFGEQFWLYVATDANTDEPQWHRIHDPATRFWMEEEVMATGFIIEEEQWR
ncbi:MAG: hypothetical protein ABIK79_02085 [Chloroflexota bacterium]